MDPVLGSTLSAHESLMLNEKEREREERAEGQMRERGGKKEDKREGERNGEERNEERGIKSRGNEEEEEMKDDLSTLYMILDQYSTPKRIN